MRDHAFTVTGGVVTKARQLDPPGNIGWERFPRTRGDRPQAAPATLWMGMVPPYARG